MGKVAPGVNGHLPVLDQLHQFPLLLPGDLVCLGGGVDAPARHHHRLHTGGQQLDQRPLRCVVCQQGKVPGDAVVQLLLAQGGLHVDLRDVSVLFHIPQMAGRAQGQRPADAKVSKQHLALLIKDGLAVLQQGQGDVFQCQTHHLFAVRVPADKADQTGHRLHKGVPRLLRQLVAIAGRAGGGVAYAAGGHQHRIRPVLPAGGAPHAHAAQRRAHLFLFGVARVFRCRRGGLCLGHDVLQQQLFCTVVDDVGVLRIAQQCLPDLLGLIRYREHPTAALHLQLHAKAFEQLHGLCRGERPQRGVQKARVRAHMAQKLLCRAVVGHVAAPLACDKDLLPGLLGMLQHRHLMSLPHGGTRRHQSGCPGSHDQNPCHLSSSQNRLLILLYHTRNPAQKQCSAAGNEWIFGSMPS